MNLGQLVAGQELSRADIQRIMAAAPALEPGATAFLVANADLVRDDYAQAFGDVVDATALGKRQKLIRYGIGAACGFALGALIFKVL